MRSIATDKLSWHPIPSFDLCDCEHCMPLHSVCILIWFHCSIMLQNKSMALSWILIDLTARMHTGALLHPTLQQFLLLSNTTAFLWSLDTWFPWYESLLILCSAYNTFRCKSPSQWLISTWISIDHIFTQLRTVKQGENQCNLTRISNHNDI